ncbi:hypothetical protein Tco_0629622 [Tanacetum coccineum]|uniref:Reverse transcriptase domain-containing protein n=1 Tax=Tanacetum coccineum TaxID=301880 RepID=A0ABQ4WTQ0_9ASTR
MKHSYSNDDTCFSIDVIDEISEKYFVALLDEGSKILYSVEGTLLEDQIFAEFDEFIAMTIKENSKSDSDKEEIPFKKITFDIDYKIKKSIDEPPMDLELKPLPNRLEYAFLEEPSFLPVIISSQLSEQNKNKLVSVLKKHKQAFSWKTTDIPVICPSFYKHKIQLLEDKRPVVQKQRRLNPNMKEVFKKEIVKLLDTRIIYQIADYPWVLRRSRSSLLQFCGDLETKDKSLARASDTRSSQEYLNDLEEEYQARVLLAKSKRFFKKGAKWFSSTKATDQTECHKCGKKCHFARDYWSKKEVSSDDNDVTKVKAIMTLADEERVSVGKESGRNGEWIKISMKKCISEQNHTQKKKILGIDQLTEDTSNTGPKDPVFVKSSADNSEVSITGINKLKLSEAEDSTLSNHDTGKVPSNESQRNTTDHSVLVSDFSATNYDSADESSVCSTLLPLLEKLTSVEPVSGTKTIKSILKSKSTFKVETLKGITINEPSSALARGKKSYSVFKTNSALAGKLKNVKIEDDHTLAIVMKELNELKLQISNNKSSYFRNENSQQIKQPKRGVSINKEKDVNDLLRMYEKIDSLVNTLIMPPSMLGHDLNDKAVNESQYKAMFSTEAEDIAAAGCYAIILWIKSQLTDYDIIYEKLPITIQLCTKKHKAH